MKNLFTAVTITIVLVCMCGSGNRQDKKPPKEFSRTNPPSGMVRIEGGTFTMGADIGGFEHRPSRKVTVSGFFIDTTEVTRSLYFRTIGAQTEDTNSNLPTDRISWFEAAEHCNLRSKRDGLDTVYEFTRQGQVITHYDRQGYRLPTEAEWEYACRAGTAAFFYWGDDVDSAELYECCAEKKQSLPLLVAQRKPNPWGLYDMLGNAREWCNDWYDDEYYEIGESSDPKGPSRGTDKVVRGGSVRGLTATYLRSKLDPMESGIAIGFRCVLPVFNHSSPSE